MLFWLWLPAPFPRPPVLASAEECAALAEGGSPAAKDLRQLQECIALDPDDVDLLADLAAAQESAGSPELAVATYRRALTLASEDGELRLRLGRLLMRRGEAAEAADQAALGLQVQPNRPELVELLGAAERAGGKAAQ